MVIKNYLVNLSRVKFAEWDGSVNGAVWPKTMILKGVDNFFIFIVLQLEKGACVDVYQWKFPL